MHTTRDIAMSLFFQRLFTLLFFIIIVYFHSIFFSYDPALGKCIEFKFGGCDGNANNFVSFKQCMDACQGKSFFSFYIKNFDSCQIECQ